MARVTLLGLGLGLAAVARAEGSGTPTLQSRIKGAYFGALSADALALSTHYEYDATKIKKVPSAAVPTAPHTTLIVASLFPRRSPTSTSRCTSHS
jgi:hypothetical protein